MKIGKLLILAMLILKFIACSDSKNSRDTIQTLNKELESVEFQIAGQYSIVDKNGINSTLVLESGGILKYKIFVEGERIIKGKWEGSAEDITLFYQDEFGKYYKMGNVIINSFGLKVVSSENFVRDYENDNGNLLDNGIRNIGKTGAIYKRL